MVEETKVVLGQSVVVRNKRFGLGGTAVVRSPSAPRTTPTAYRIHLKGLDEKLAALRTLTGKMSSSHHFRLSGLKIVSWSSWICMGSWVETLILTMVEVHMHVFRVLVVVASETRRDLERRRRTTGVMAAQTHVA